MMQQELDAFVLSEGIAIGKPFFLEEESEIKLNSSKFDSSKELTKFKRAINKSKKQIIDLKKHLSDDDLHITFEILDTHLELLNDPTLLDAVEEKIVNENKGIESSFNEIIEEYKNKIKDPFFKERIKDIVDVFKRISSHIRVIKVEDFYKDEKSIIFLSSEIIPSDIYDVKENVKAFISLNGSFASHAAILARSRGVPFISKVDVKKLKSKNLNQIIVDGINGKIIINPTQNTLDKYLILKEKKKEEKINFNIKKNDLTKFFINITSAAEAKKALEDKISGIGLFRSEFLILENSGIPPSNKQYLIYKKIAKELKDKPFIIRLFDLGADKNFLNNEEVDFFSKRGAKFLIKNPKILKNQLIAILKSSVYKNIKILIPFVTSTYEIKYILKLIEDIKEDFKKKNIEYSDIQIGCMIETPAAAIECKEILKLVDFISIGTNDLSRYTLADNSLKFDEIPSALFKLIESVVKVAKRSRKDLYICGELASIPKFIEQFKELKIENFSINISSISQIDF
ncbi:MAG: Phosphoenolpyruvate-protein phosphotransferase [Candidatus Anoxychlamydiales bacterium]|nr:Phosphoenolpyruvate-protein phosphotransferase [Candidatus Anoxychlamydiales bacterium]